MKTIVWKTIIGLILTIPYFCNATAQTPVYYQYDGAGNRYLRSITLTKSAKVDSTANKQANNKKTEAFQDNLGDIKVLIYPNPTLGQLKIDFEGFQGDSNSGLYIYNLSGSLIISKIPANSSNLLNLSGNPTGIYILKIVVGNKKTEWKIIKE